jgi:hypothetical protein
MWFSLIAHVTTYQWKGASEKYDFNDIDHISNGEQVRNDFNQIASKLAGNKH